MTTSPLDMTEVREVDGRTVNLVWVVQPRIVEAGRAWVALGERGEFDLWGYLSADFWPVEAN